MDTARHAMPGGPGSYRGDQAGIPGHALVVVGLVALSAWTAPFTGAIRLTLEGGFMFEDLVVEAKCVDGEWERTLRAWPGAIDAGKAYRGTVSEGRISDTEVSLESSLLVDGEWNRYALDLKRDGDSLSGTYAGEMWSMPLSGRAEGSVVALDPDYVTVAPGEHPRLFFRKNQLDWLRERANTPQGRKAIDKLKALLPADRGGFCWCSSGAPNYTEGRWAAGHALMWVLFGKREDLVRATQITIEAMIERGGEESGWGRAPRWAGVAYAYDLCYNDWDPEFRQQVARFLQEFTYYGGPRLGRRDAMFNAAAGLCALAILDDPLPAPAEPEPPSKVTRVVQPDKGYTPGNGVPVVPFILPDLPNTTGNMPKEWLLALGFAPETGDDPLSSIGGRVGARPRSGTKATYKEHTVEFLPAGNTSQLYGQVYKVALNPAFTWYGSASSCQPTAYFRERLCRAYGFTVINNDKERVALAQPNDPGNNYGTRMWLAGQEVKDGETFRMFPGNYPLLVEMPVHGLWSAPMLKEYDDAMYRELHTRWKQEEEERRAFGGACHGTAAAEKLASYVRRFALAEISLDGKPDLSEGAYNNGTFYATNMTEHVLPFAQAYVNVTGKDFARGTGIPELMPFFMKNPGSYSNDYCKESWRTHGYRDILPEHYRSTVKMKMDEHPALGVETPWEAVFALVNYPWSDAMPPTNAGSPAAVRRKAGASAGVPLRLYDLRGRRTNVMRADAVGPGNRGRLLPGAVYVGSPAGSGKTGGRLVVVPW